MYFFNFFFSLLKRVGQSERGLEGQLGFLTEQVEFLKDKVDELSARLYALENGKAQDVERLEGKETITPVQQLNVPSKEGVLKKAGTGALLPRFATVCFAMVT